MENFLNSRLSINFDPLGGCEKPSHAPAESLLQLAAELAFTPTIHNFHRQCTSLAEEDLLAKWKSLATVPYPPNCSVNLLISLFKSLSFLRTSSIFSTECKTVV